MQIEKYKRRARNNVAKSTLNSRLSGQRNLQEWLGEDREPTVEDVEEWVDHLIRKYEDGEIKASTIREYFKAVRYYFSTIKGEPDSLEHIDWLPSNDSDAGEYLTEEELEMMIDSVRGFRDKAFLSIMYYYARRPMEVILLNEEDINYEEEKITFNILKKKDPNNTAILELEDEEYRVFRATFDLLEEPREALDKWMEFKRDYSEDIVFDGEKLEVSPLFTTTHGRISYHTVYNMIKQAVDNAGIDKNITPKGAGRHSRATHLDWAGKAPGNIGRDMLLHDPDTNVIGRYVHDRGEEQVRETMTIEDN